MQLQHTRKRRNIRSKIPESKNLTNQRKNIRNIKHHVGKDISIALVNKLENSIRISTTEHPTKSTSDKTETIGMKELNCTPAKNITGEITVESFYNTFAKKDENAATEAFKKLQFRFQRCKLVRKKKLIKERTKLKEAVFIVGHSAIKKINGYLLTKSINQKFLVKVRPFTTAKTIDMYDYLKRTLRDFWHFETFTRY